MFAGRTAASPVDQEYQDNHPCNDTNDREKHQKNPQIIRGISIILDHGIPAVQRELDGAVLVLG